MSLLPLANTLELIVGVVVAAFTLRDLFDTVVVPGESHGQLRVVRRLVFLVLPWATRKSTRELGVGFAPGILLLSFITWMLLLVLSFGLMIHSERAAFDAPLASFGGALALAGSALATVGSSRSEASGLAAVITVTAGLCGLAAMTMAVTYLLQVQGSVHERDKGILKLTTSAGHPPSGIGLIERYAALDSRRELSTVLAEARDWCAGVLQSHASHPSLIYFRSRAVSASWPTALGAVMDAALIFEHLLDAGERSGRAVLVREEASGLGRELAGLLELDLMPVDTAHADVQRLLDRLVAAGYRPRRDVDIDAFIAGRRACVAPIQALCRHLGSPSAPLIPA